MEVGVRREAGVYWNEGAVTIEGELWARILYAAVQEAVSVVV